MKTDRLREARLALNLTQQALAEILSTTQRQIVRWEKDETVPSSDDIKRLAQVLDVSTDYLLGLTDNPTPPAFAAVQLSSKERQAIAAWRRGARLEAVKVIIDDEG